MSPALNALEQIYFQLQANLNMMLAACATQADRDAVYTQLVAARVNYYACVNKAFHDDDPALQGLVAEAGSCIDSLKKINDQLGDIAKVINILTQAVSVGAKIAEKVIVP